MKLALAGYRYWMMKAVIDEDNSHTCGELAEPFPDSDEIVRLHLYRIEKAYKPIKWIPHTVS